jgi:O-antigen/teichoic acid export membrane protein
MEGGVSATTDRSSASPTRDPTHEQIRGSSLLFAGKFVTMAIHFAAQILIVRYLSKGDYGAFAYALSFVTLGQAIATFGLDRAVTRFVPIFQERGEGDKALGALVLAASTAFALGLAIVLVTVGFRGLVSKTLVTNDTAVTLFLILIALAPIQALDSVFMGMFAVYSKPRAIFVRKFVLEPGLRLVVVIALIGVGADVTFLAFGYVAAGIIGVVMYAAILFRLLRREGFLSLGKFRSMRIPAGEVLVFTIPLLTSDLVYLVMNTSDAFLLGRYRGVDAVGAFRVVQPAARLNQVVFTSFALLFTPLAARLFARTDHEGLDRLYWSTALWIAVLTFPVFVLTFSFAQPVTETLYGARYASSAVYLVLLSFAYYFNAAVGFNGLTLKVVGRLRYVVMINVGATAVNILVNVLLIPRFGAVGAAIGTTLTLIVFNVLKQSGLLFGTGVRILPQELRVVYGVVFSVPLLLLVLQLLLSPPLPVGLVCVGIASFGVARFARRHLLVGQSFPEVMRFRLVRWMIGSD